MPEHPSQSSARWIPLEIVGELQGVTIYRRGVVEHWLWRGGEPRLIDTTARPADALVELEELLIQVFPDFMTLRQFLPRPLRADLPGDQTSLSAGSHELVAMLERRGLISQPFFDSLAREAALQTVIIALLRDRLIK